eukprot:6805476-Prymnesium_polylepis.1
MRQLVGDIEETQRRVAKGLEERGDDGLVLYGVELRQKGGGVIGERQRGGARLSLIHISEPTRRS